MIRAAVDARTGFPALVIADCSTIPPRCIFAGSTQVGHNVTRDGPGLAFKREASEEEIADVASQFLDRIHGSECTQVQIEKPSSRSFSRVLVDRIEDACAGAGLLVTVVSTGSDGVDSVPQCFDEWPEEGFRELPDGWREGNYAGTRRAGRMLLGAVPITRVPRAPRETPRSDVAPKPAGHVSEWVETELRDPAVARAYEEARPFTLALPSGPRIMAIDTGGHIGVCIAEKVGGKFRRVMSRTITVDATDAAQRKDFIIGLAKLMRTESVERVVIEVVTHVHGGDRGTGDSAINSLRMMATQLVRANWIGGMVEAMIISAPVEVDIEILTAPSSHWRRRVCGKDSVSSEGGVSAKVREYFPEWPDTSTVHERDAAGLLIWDAMGQAVPPLRVRNPSGTRLQAKIRRAGCTCPVGHRGAHLGACPMRAARKAGTVQKCKLCGQPRRGHVCTAQKIDTSTEKVLESSGGLP